MRWTVATLALLLGGCSPEGTEEAPVEATEAPAPEAAPVAERSPEETEPHEARPSIELTGGSVAGMHEQALRDADRARGAQMLETACDRGFEPSCLALAERLEAGDGVEADPDRASQIFEASCMAGSTAACDRLGH